MKRCRSCVLEAAADEICDGRKPSVDIERHGGGKIASRKRLMI